MKHLVHIELTFCDIHGIGDVLEGVQWIEGTWIGKGSRLVVVYEGSEGATVTPRRRQVGWVVLGGKNSREPGEQGGASVDSCVLHRRTEVDLEVLNQLVNNRQCQLFVPINNISSTYAKNIIILL